NKSNVMINIGLHKSSRWVKKFGYIAGPHQKLHLLRYGPYTITNIVGDNAFKFNIPPFLGLHPVFNVDHLR
ncbi:hypothetical protein DK853_52800, partial [Klebsiella oxytoca]